MSAVKTIPLQAVADALMFAKVRLVAGREGRRQPGRWAAYTQSPTWEPACREAHSARRLGAPPRRATPQHLGPMARGTLQPLLERVRYEHGLPEVRRTWGAGMRALQREFADGVMR